MVSWLEPRTPERAAEEHLDSLGHVDNSNSTAFVCCRQNNNNNATDQQQQQQQQQTNTTSNDNTRGQCGGNCQVDDVEEVGGASRGKPPLWEILYFHRAIRSALQSFAEEAKALRDSEGGMLCICVYSVV